MELFSHFKYVFSALMISFFAVIPLLHTGLPPTHDGEYHIVRFYEFDKVLRSGEWYPRWAPDFNNGYGIPLFNYVYPFPNYVAFFLHLFGISFIDAFKLNMFLATLVGASFMYLWAREFFDEWAGLLSSTIYTYAPYHLLDVYIRGSVGEVWALAFFPGFFWAMTRLIKGGEFIYVILSAVLFALIIFSHNILALMFFPLAASFVGLVIWKIEKKLQIVYKIIFAFLLSFGLSCIFWLPAIAERSFVRGLEIFDYKEHFVELYQLILPSWGSGFSGDLATQGLSVQIGIINLVILFTTVLIIARKEVQHKPIIIFMLLWIFLAVFLMLPLTEKVWEIVPFMRYFQFPWRFLSLVVLGCAFLSGSIVYVFRSRVFIILLLFATITMSISYTKPAYYLLRDDNYYISRSNFMDGTNSPGNAFNTIWFNDTLEKRNTFSKETEEGIVINTAYFPGWQVLINGIKVKTTADKDGLIFVKKPFEAGEIEIVFIDTPVRMAAKIVTVLSVMIICLLLLRNARVRIRISP